MVDPRAILEAAEKATPGPWKVTDYGGETLFFDAPAGWGTLAMKDCAPDAKPRIKASLEFAALSRTAAPELARRVVRLEEGIRRVNAVVTRDGVTYCVFCARADGLHADDCIWQETWNRAKAEARAAIAGEEER
jgi:hypothetical protein